METSIGAGLLSLSAIDFTEASGGDSIECWMKKSTRVPDGSESMKPADAQAEEPDVTTVGIRWNCCSCLQLNSMMNWYNQCSAELQCLEDPSRRWLYIMFSYGHLLANKSHG